MNGRPLRYRIFEKQHLVNGRTEAQGVALLRDFLYGLNRDNVLVF